MIELLEPRHKYNLLYSYFIVWNERITITYFGDLFSGRTHFVLIAILACCRLNIFDILFVLTLFALNTDFGYSTSGGGS